MGTTGEDLCVVSVCSEASDEELCRRCGLCCRVKLLIDDELVATPFVCPHLDRETRLCTIYERRFELNPFCVSAVDGVEARIFPADCPYVRGAAGYRGPREATPEEIAAHAHVCVASQVDLRRIANERDRQGVLAP